MSVVVGVLTVPMQQLRQHNAHFTVHHLSTGFDDVALISAYDHSLHRRDIENALLRRLTVVLLLDRPEQIPLRCAEQAVDRSVVLVRVRFLVPAAIAHHGLHGRTRGNVCI